MNHLLAITLFSASLAYASPATRLEFASGPQSIPQGTCAQIGVVTENGPMQLTPVTTATKITVSGNGLSFYSNSACTIKSNTFTISAGQDSGSFYVSGMTQGTFLISITSVPSLNAQTQKETIVAPPAPPCGGQQSPPSIAPIQASSNGFTKLVLDDEFNSASMIAPTATSSGAYNWYPWNPFTTSAELPATGYTVANGCLTINTDLSGYSAGLLSVNSSNVTHGAFQHAYFESRMLFNPEGHTTGAWPAFWSYAVQGIQSPVIYPFAELDFMECYPNGSTCTILTTIHQWTSQSANNQNSDVPPLPKGFDYTQWHIYGCLWTANSLTWYIDNLPVLTTPTGPGTNFTALEQEQMFLILGTGKNWPTTYDYVRVWQ